MVRPSTGSDSSCLSADAPTSPAPAPRCRPPPAPFRDRLRRTSPILAFPAALIVLGITFGSVDIITPALPTVRDALGTNGTTAGLIISLFFLGRPIMSVPARIMVDRLGVPVTTAIGDLVIPFGMAIGAVCLTGTLFMPSPLRLVP